MYHNSVLRGYLWQIDPIVENNPFHAIIHIEMKSSGSWRTKAPSKVHVAEGFYCGLIAVRLLVNGDDC